MKNLMAIMATTKATMLPTIKAMVLFDEAVINSYPFELVPSNYQYFNTSEYPVAAAMVGTAKRKENSAANRRVIFCVIPPIMVAALLLIPGMATANT
jgi:hypothetical protein